MAEALRLFRLRAPRAEARTTPSSLVRAVTNRSASPDIVIFPDNQGFGGQAHTVLSPLRATNKYRCRGIADNPRSGRSS